MRRSSTVISPAAFSGGAFVVHQPNFANYYQQAMMHRQAKQQALAQYYDRVQSSVNPAGVRDVDMEGWQKKADDWNKFGIEHRDELVDTRRDGGKALGQFNAMHRDLLLDTQKSKQAASKEMGLQRIYSDPKKAERATNQDLNLAHSLSASIYNPQHYQADGVTPHDLTEFSFNAPAYDINKQKAVASIVTRGLKPDRTYGKAGGIDPTTRLTVVPFQEKHSTNNLKTISERMGQVYDSDKSVQGHYDNETADPQRFDQLSQAYKSVYPNDEMGNDPRKHAMADAILDNSQVRNSSELRSVSRPPVGRGLTKAQQDQQLMVGLTNQMAAAMKAGNLDEVKRLGGVWFSGNGKSQYQDIDQGPAGVGNPKGMSLDQNVKNAFILKHIDKVWTPDDPKNPAVGAYKDKLVEDAIDPNDPQLSAKLARYHQNFMGSTPSIERGIVGQTLNPQSAPAAAPVKNPAPVDIDKTLNKYLAQ